MSHLVILRGPTKSGKSSIAKKLYDCFGYKDVDIDRIGDRVSHENAGDIYSHLDRYERILCQVREEVVKHLENDFSVVLEEAFAERVYINYLKLFVIEPLRKKYSPEISVFYIWCPLNVALERNKLADRQLDEQVVRYQYSRFNGTDSYGLKIDTSLITLEDAVEIIQRNLHSDSRLEL